MAKITRFEEIESWRKSRELTKSIYRITLKQSFSRDFGLRDQIRRAAVSVLSNIAGGFDETVIRVYPVSLAGKGLLR